ncbi:histone chaperone domain CHZ-domain-containing protein [Penicillium hispanicum]|uniref:histone chaperone domain CHZ-domain-containing protein n=1 Tax=Penicillium hispanicum TaxID=1080232 RepID=UPI00253FC57F|nr:histone chaperone domain CHZ-domain-containing protein [Penicillium hispanicum]KAJ5584132.1 histone chaperone domain CHZ-domain-containing protein [Penicillium hispanicum]
MGDHATSNDPAANAPDAAAFEKGKGKAQDPTNEMSMDEESESESENELPENDEDEDENGGLEPISQENIIQGGRRTRGKVINYADVAEKSQNAGDEMEDDDDDEDFRAADEDNDNDDQMRD